ncbi:MAG: 3-hydroxybutyryl-CoA dehydrogenase [Deferrisomatales bacterium]|nr:3-hydroxybutyryl-CoA dehydrogenase [Deferrisomatales bacterium]
MEIRNVGVAGCGLMGGGIAQVCAQAGYRVMVLEMEQRFLDKGLGAIAKNLARAVAKGKLPQAEMDAVLGRITGTTVVVDLRDSDLVIEAIIENPQAKTDLFGALDGVCPAHTVFASNTSSIPIIEIAAATQRPDRFVGLHFFNPVPVMQLVEVIRTIQSSDASVANATAFAQSLGKKTIQAKDRAGFVVNFLLVPYLYEAIRMLETGMASREDIDTGMVLGCNYPMGPLTLADYVGLDTLCAIGDIFFEAFREARYAAPLLLRQMVAAGLYGRKSGKGFYDYG